MIKRYFEDLKIGNRFHSKKYRVSEKEIVAFAKVFDPQRFHTNAIAAGKSVFKGLVASGWHTAAITMRLFVKTLNFAKGAIGLGVDELRWPNPVRPGDTLKVETRIIGLRRSRSKPDQAIVRLSNKTTNQHGKVVQTMFASALVKKRSK